LPAKPPGNAAASKNRLSAKDQEPPNHPNRMSKRRISKTKPIGTYMKPPQGVYFVSLPKLTLKRKLQIRGVVRKGGQKDIDDSEHETPPLRATGLSEQPLAV
jgi:hypothetical protein